MKNNNKPDNVEALLKISGPRKKPTEQAYKAVYSNVRDVWTKQNNKAFYLQQKFRIAASIILIIGSVTFGFIAVNKDEVLNMQISKNTIISGQIEVSKDQNNWAYLKKNQPLVSGDFIRTSANNRILVTLTNGNSFRLDENSTMQLSSQNSIALYRGQIYVESNEQQPHEKLIISTSYGSINHIGTKYNVEIQPNYLNVSVRKGKVLFQNKGQNKEVQKGFKISVDSTGDVQKSSLSPHDAKWKWTQKIASHFQIQDKSIVQYLNWVSQETGYPIVWNSFKLENLATTIILSGSIEGLAPLESLSVILPTTNFNYKISKTSIQISD